MRYADGHICGEEIYRYWPYGVMGAQRLDTY